MVRVNVKDPNVEDIGFDVNGEFIMAYNGIPFTGIIEFYFPDKPQQLSGEEEHKDGYRVGIQSTYYPNGRKKYEYTKGKGGFDGWFRTWDESGNLTYEKLWINGVEQS